MEGYVNIISLANMCEDCDEDLLDVGCNADLYVANHESVDLIYEDQVRDISSILILKY